MFNLPPFVENNLQWWISGVIVVISVFLYGANDLMRLSGGRIWAISSVCFAESYRRKVLWITPLAVVGVIAVAQLQKPVDEQDAIRQTIKFCLFATGLLVTVTAVILACTNLPKEIDNRVIYTVVTKPTTRLEIVLGKILGFARVSGAILIIMGLFTLGYLHVRAWRFERWISQRLETPDAVDAVMRPTLEHYREVGLLTAQQMLGPRDLEVYSRPPDLRTGLYYMCGAGEGDMLIPFVVKPSELIPPGDPTGTPGLGGLHVVVRIGADPIPDAPPEPLEEPASPLPPFIRAPNAPPTTAPKVRPPSILVRIFDVNQNNLVTSRDSMNDQPKVIEDPTGRQPTHILISPAPAQSIVRAGQDKDEEMLIYVEISGETPGYEYFVDRNPVSLIVPAAEGFQPVTLSAAADRERPTETSPPIFRGKEGLSGQIIHGKDRGVMPIAIFRFDHAVPDLDEEVRFEFKSRIDQTGASAPELDAGGTHMTVVAYNRDTGQESPPARVPLESNRPAFFGVPAQLIGAGNIDIRVRCDGPNNITVMPSALSMVISRSSFTANLIKGLLIMWLMSVLVVTTAIFTSTFLSWPIAVVVTLVILLGHWGVQQLGDAIQPGVGNVFATDMGFTDDPNKAKVVSSSVEALSRGLKLMGAVLPDISQFASSEDLERGLAIPWEKLRDSLGVLGCYGLAEAALAYVLLRQKEVAP